MNERLRKLVNLELSSFNVKKALLKDPPRAGITISVLLYEALLELAQADSIHGNGKQDAPSQLRDARQKVIDELERIL